ncbi:MAG: hypothetical protein OQK82_05565 [Candidatus Pacearchaeota archaeon]|nr:hypothetical protein [Candidatus Pacearchaeota archaeon]
MVNEEILGGLRIAITHNSSLKDAMQSFYNAGYNKAEVEEAGKMILYEQKNNLIDKTQGTKPIGQNKTQIKPLPTQTKITEKESSKKLGLIILLSGILLILLGIMVLLFLYKDKIF